MFLQPQKVRMFTYCNFFKIFHLNYNVNLVGDQKMWACASIFNLDIETTRDACFPIESQLTK